MEHPLDISHFSSLPLNLNRTFKELSKPEEQLSLCRELCEDLAEDLKKEGLKVVTECRFMFYLNIFLSYMYKMNKLLVLNTAYQEHHHNMD